MQIAAACMQASRACDKYQQATVYSQGWALIKRGMKLNGKGYIKSWNETTESAWIVPTYLWPMEQCASMQTIHVERIA